MCPLPYPGEIAVHIRRYVRKDRMLLARTVMEALRKQMVDDMATVLHLSAQDRVNLDGVTHWYFGVMPENEEQEARLRKS